MPTGTISDFDANGQFGVIDADDGQLVLFNLWDLEPSLRAHFRIGSRVQFSEGRDNLAPRALELLPLSAHAGSHSAGPVP